MSDDIKKDIEVATTALGLASAALGTIIRAAQIGLEAARAGGAEAAAKLAAELARLERAEGAVGPAIEKNDAEADAAAARARLGRPEEVRPAAGAPPAPPSADRVSALMVGFELALGEARAEAARLVGRVAALESALLASDERQRARCVELQRGPIASLSDRVGALEALAGLGGPQPPAVVAGPPPRLTPPPDLEPIPERPAAPALEPPPEPAPATEPQPAPAAPPIADRISPLDE